ncbi:MAG: hypothetical protein WC444_04610 [Candidatus Paceibacterota bacterium]
MLSESQKGITKDELILIYELMYKWGMIQSYEREHGYLPDHVLRYATKIESDLRFHIKQGLEALIEACEAWIEYHTFDQDGWYVDILEIDSLKEQIKHAMATLLIDRHDVLKVIKKLIPVYLNGYNEKDLWSIVHQLEDEIKAIHKEFFYELSEDEYKHWMNHPVVKSIVHMKNSLQIHTDDLGDLVSAFNRGVSTAHHHGQLGEYILKDSGPQIFDDLSSGKYTGQWDKDLEKILGRKVSTLILAAIKELT